MPLQVRPVLEESLSIAVILSFWSFLSVLAVGDGRVQFAILLGGFVMAALYAVVRGVAMSAGADPAYRDPDARTVLRENGRVALAGAPWFVLALFTAVLWRNLPYLGVPLHYEGGILWTVVGTLVQTFAVTGAFTVLLVAVASGTSALRSER